jgi:hypothetical protein
MFSRRGIAFGIKRLEIMTIEMFLNMGFGLKKIFIALRIERMEAREGPIPRLGLASLNLGIGPGKRRVQVGNMFAVRSNLKNSFITLAIEHMKVLDSQD